MTSYWPKGDSIIGLSNSFTGDLLVFAEVFNILSKIYKIRINSLSENYSSAIDILILKPIIFN